MKKLWYNIFGILCIQPLSSSKDWLQLLMPILANLKKDKKRQWSFTNYLLLSFPFLPCQAYYYAKVRQWNQVSLKGGSQVNFQCPRRKPSKFPRTTLFVPWSLGHCSVLSKGGCKMSDEWLDLMIWVFESLKLNVSIKFEYRCPC